MFRSLKINKKPTDIDELSAWFIKQCIQEFSEPLTVLVNSSFYTGMFPSRLKWAKVTPLFKKCNANVKVNIQKCSVNKNIHTHTNKKGYCQETFFDLDYEDDVECF